MPELPYLPRAQILNDCLKVYRIGIFLLSCQIKTDTDRIHSLRKLPDFQAVLLLPGQTHVGTLLACGYFGRSIQ